jgi:hypothetical protein
LSEYCRICVALLQNTCRSTAECVLITAGYVFEYCKICDSTTDYVSKYCRMCRSTVECVSYTAKYMSEHCRICVEVLRNMLWSTAEYVSESCRMCTEVLQNRLWSTAEYVSEYCRMCVGVQQNKCRVLQSMFQSTA